jgi:hypothetical protein
MREKHLVRTERIRILLCEIEDSVGIIRDHLQDFDSFNTFVAHLKIIQEDFSPLRETGTDILVNIWKTSLSTAIRD